MAMRELLEKTPEALKNPVTIRLPGITPAGKLSIGCGLALTVGQEVKALGASRVMLLVDPVLEKLGLSSEIKESLAAEQIDFEVFTDIAPEPHMSCLEAATEMVRKGGFEAVIGVGGGSTMDTAKFAAVIALCDCTPDELMANGALGKEKLPLILMPTTSGTGSEVSPYVVASSNERKLFIGTPVLYPTVALVDPLLTASAPSRVTAATGLDALSHGVEGVCGATNPYTLAMAEKCVELVFTYLPRAVADGGDLAARYYMSFASVMGMLAYTQGGGLYAHSVSYMLTMGKGHAHGVGCGMALPYTLAYNRECISPVLKAFAQAITRSGFAMAADEQDVIRCFKQLVETVGIPDTLCKAGFAAEELDEFAETLIAKYYRARNPRPMSVAEARVFTQNMFDGRLD